MYEEWLDCWCNPSRVKSIQDFYSESERDHLIADTFLLGWSLYRTFTQNLRENDLQWIRCIALESTRGEMPLRVMFTAFYNCSGPRGLIMFVLWAVPMHLRKHAGAESLHAFHVLMYVEWLGFLTYSYTTWTRPRFKPRGYEGFVSTIRCHPLRLIRYMFDSRKVELFKDQVILCSCVLVPSSVSLCL